MDAFIIKEGPLSSRTGVFRADEFWILEAAIHILNCEERVVVEGGEANHAWLRAADEALYQTCKQ